MHRLTITALFAVFFLVNGLQSQNLEVGLAGGLAYYNGDLNPGLPFQDAKAAYGLVARYSKSTRWAYRLTVLNGTLASSAANPRVDAMKGSTFSKNFQEANVVAEFNFFDYFTGSEKSYATPYLFAGLGITRIPIADMIGAESSQMPMNTSFGLGFKYSLTDRLALGGEWGMRRSFSDAIDHATSVPLDNQLHWDDPGKTDWYNFTGLSLTYRFSLQKKHKCDAFQNRIYKK